MRIQVASAGSVLSSSSAVVSAASCISSRANSRSLRESTSLTVDAYWAARVDSSRMATSWLSLFGTSDGVFIGFGVIPFCHFLFDERAERYGVLIDLREVCFTCDLDDVEIVGARCGVSFVVPIVDLEGFVKISF